MFFVQYPGTPRSCRRPQRLSPPRNTPLVLHPFSKNQKKLIWLPFLERRKVENKDIPLFFYQYPGTPGSCRKRQRLSPPRNTLLVLHPFPKNQKEGVNLANFSEEKKSGEKKDIPLFFVQYPGTPRSCRRPQRCSLPRNTPLVLHPFPKNQKEGVNLPLLKRRKVEKKTYHCFLSNILALLRVTGNAYVLLLFKVLRLFYICFFKTKQRLNLPFLKSRREFYTTIPFYFDQYSRIPQYCRKSQRPFLHQRAR